MKAPLFRMLKINLFLLTIALMLFNCASTTLLTLQESKNCLTSIEGYYECYDEWTGSKPALIIKEGSELLVLEGKIIYQDENGVNFDQKKVGPFYDPEPKYYKFSEIVTLINNDGKIVSGSIPKKFSESLSLQFLLVPYRNQNAKTVQIVLESKRKFGFCIPPGIYRIGTICFIGKDDNMDYAAILPKMYLDIKANCSNYIGNFYLNPKENIENNLLDIVIPYKIGSRPHGAALAGILGGAIGGALYGAANASKGVIGEHRMLITYDESFQPTCSSKLNVNEIQIMETKSDSFKVSAFNPERDFISLHYDHAPDKDDGQSAAADRTLLQSRFGAEWLRSHIIPVSGAYGKNGGLFNPGSDAVMNAAWNDRGGWLAAHTDRETVLSKLLARWSGVLKIGGDVWVKEGGQSDLTAETVKRVSAYLPEIDTKKHIHVVQHSDWNEQQTTDSALTYVKEHTDYIRIADANRYLNIEKGDEAFVRFAVSHPIFGPVWKAAFDYYNPTERLDFSDTGELMHILGLGEMGIDQFRIGFLME